jgi:hypothetical protein
LEVTAFAQYLAQISEQSMRLVRFAARTDLESIGLG